MKTRVSMTEGLAQLILKSEPFHVAFNRDLMVTSVGPSLLELGGLDQIGTPLQCIVEAMRPRIGLSFEALCSRRDSVFSLIHLPTGIPLRGQVLVDETSGHGVFIGIPWFPKVEDYTKRGIRLNMLPVHYGMVETLFLLQTNQATIEDFKRLTLQMTRQQADLREARHEIQVASEARTRFFAMMSHEIRTPMSGIKGMIDILQDTKLDQEQADYFRTLDHCVKSLMVILDDLLDFSKIDVAKLQLNPEPFDLVELIDSTVSLMRPTAIGKGIRLDLTMPEGETTFVSGDRYRIRQVILNLLSNALKFTSEGYVSLTVGRSVDHHWHFTVADSGLGMTEEALSRLFRPFEQASSETASEFGGTGLGLFISRNLVELMGGDINVSSTAGVGSTFQFTIPLPAESKPEEDAFAGEAAAGNALTSNISILLAEDNDVNAIVVEHFVESLGANLVRTQNGAEAVRLATERQFDVILMDCQMPVLNGYDASRQIRALGGQNETVPIIALTANTSVEDETACREAGMNAFVSKPIDAEQLRRAIREALA
jgi:two-component system, sensor histidine kinase